MNIPAELKYSETHEWIKRNADGSLTIGITDHAQDLLGDMVFVENPVPGRHLAAGEECGVLESVKAASDLYAPVAGEVLAVNVALETAPEAINQDAYAAWMFTLKPDHPADVDALLDATAYRRFIESEQH